MEPFGDSFGRSWSAVLGTCVPSEYQKNKLVRVVEGRSKVCRQALVPAPYGRNTESGVYSWLAGSAPSQRLPWTEAYAEKSIHLCGRPGETRPMDIAQLPVHVHLCR